MELDLSDDQAAVRDAFAKLFEHESTPARIRATESTGFDPALWDLVVGMGGTTLALPEEHGGGGGDLLDLALVVAEQGCRLAAVPIVETAVASRLLAAVGAADAVREVIASESPIALALHPARDGIAALVPSGASATWVVGLDGDELVLVGSPDQRMTPRSATLAAPLADWFMGASPAGSRTVLATGAFAADTWSAARCEWKALSASLLAGAGGGALALAVDHVRERQQFGAPLGSFQTVAHRLADAAVELDGARLLSLRSTWALDHEDPNRDELSAMAFAYSAETAQRAVRESLHFFGGYGFMLEYDIQLYFRRVKAWTLALGDPVQEYVAIGRDLRPALR